MEYSVSIPKGTSKGEKDKLAGGDRLARGEKD